MPLDFLRQFRIDGYAIFDFTIAFIGAYLLAPLLSKMFLKIGVVVPKRNWLFLVLPIGIVIHLLIGVMTPMTKAFMDAHDHYIVKATMVALLLLGIRGIRMVKK